MCSARTYFVGLVLLLVATTGCDRYHRSTTVIKIAVIPVPSNLSDAAECQTLWGDISRHGIEMDALRKDWNQVVLNSTTLLIEKGCVKKVNPGAQ